MSLLLWFALAAHGQQECQTSLRPPPDALSVIWVSPLRAKASGNGWLQVVRTDELRAWVAAESQGSVGRMLQYLGLRRSDREPKKRYKITIFDAPSSGLCRPLDGYDDPAAIEGMVTCPAKLGKVTSTYDGCGFTTDQATGEVGLELYGARWNDVARNGFCVLPAERFVEGRIER